MATGKTMRAIEEAIAKLEAERNRIDGRIEGLREALRLQGAAPPAANVPAHKRTRRGNLKKTVLAVAEQVSETGMTVDDCVRIAKEKGIDLVRGSVASLFSRLKSEDVLFYDGQKYRLKHYAGPRHVA